MQLNDDEKQKYKKNIKLGFKNYHYPYGLYFFVLPTFSSK